MEKKFEIDQILFQDLVQYYGGLFNLPPLAAKIYCFLFFDFERKGVSFEELMHIFQVSKSSVSTSLCLLLQLELLKEYSKIGERKRNFVINEDYAKFKFVKIISNLKEEISILDRLQAFRGENSEQYLWYRDMVNKNIEIMQNSLDKL